MSKKRSALLALVAIAVIAIMIALAARPRPDNPETTIANETEVAEAVPVIDMVSVPSAFPFLERWVAQYNDQGAASVDVNYGEGTGSELAIVGNATVNGKTYVPVGPQAVAVVYNIPSFPDVPTGLKLNSTVLSSILNGTIARWSDASIRELNPSLNLPDEEIIVVREISNSSSLLLLQDYLGSNIAWANSSEQVPGPAELASMVRKTPYSIGYVDFSYATQTKMTYAAVENFDGMYVVPSTDSIASSVKLGMQNVTGLQIINSSRLGNSSYPLAGLYYAALPDNADDVTVDFVAWLIDGSGGQQTLSEVQYPAIDSANATALLRARMNSSQS